MNFVSQDTLPSVSVLGFGAVTPMGRDLQLVASLLGRPPAARLDSPLRIADELLSDTRTDRALRRAGRSPRMAVLAAIDAWDEAGLACRDVAADRVGVIVASGLGPHERTFKFLDGILDCGDDSALPTDFSHSVHNAAAAYITATLGFRGRSCTVADFAVGFEQAVLLAQVWLAEGACDRVVVGAVEELGDVLLHVLPRMLASASIGARTVPGEGACFFTLGPSAVAGLAELSATARRDAVDLFVMDEPALPSIASPEASPPVRARRAVTFSPYFGHSATSSAFQTLGGLLCLRTGRVLGKDVHSARGARLTACIKNPLPLGGEGVLKHALVETPNPTASVDSVWVCKRSSRNESLSLLLTRPGI